MQAGRDLRRERNAVRRAMRERRRALGDDERRTLDRAVCAHVMSQPVFRAARRIGIYLAFDGEPDLERVIRAAARAHKRLFVPALERREMHFVAFAPQARMTRNFFGISEPENAERVDVRKLDLVLTPLVAFDARGGRLGVGRGYFDRCFAFLRRRSAWFKPKLLGVGYAFQEIPQFALQPWDVPLWGVVTERGLVRRD